MEFGRGPPRARSSAQPWFLGPPWVEHCSPVLEAMQLQEPLIDVEVTSCCTLDVGSMCRLSSAGFAGAAPFACAASLGLAALIATAVALPAPCLKSWSTHCQTASDGMQGELSLSFSVNKEYLPPSKRAPKGSAPMLPAAGASQPGWEFVHKGTSRSRGCRFSCCCPEHHRYGGMQLLQDSPSPCVMICSSRCLQASSV